MSILLVSITSLSAWITYFGTKDYLFGIEGPHEWKNIVRGLVSEGYSDEEIRKIIGENAMKIIEKVIG
ncbi:MAG: membrane dipeptidase [Candidatus Hodarchaeales archaeon]